jgi:hypothetical protein
MDRVRKPNISENEFLNLTTANVTVQVWETQRDTHCKDNVNSIVVETVLCFTRNKLKNTNHEVTEKMLYGRNARCV